MGFGNRTLLVALALTLSLLISALGCQLEGGEDEEAAYGTSGETFKIIIDDIGRYPEIDATGYSTGRRGLYYDQDLDGLPD
ncbi:MAG: hypothetical protein M5R36_16450 [Deltaproteobacteria bacterium]|nr:hypothetical protein [Deltaproteobacteria bacterium]